MKRFILFILFLSILCFGVSCKKENEEEIKVDTYTIHFISEDHPIECNDISFTDPSLVVLPTPTTKGYKFVKWEFRFGKQVFDASKLDTIMKMADNYLINLYAVWENAYQGYDGLVTTTITTNESTNTFNHSFSFMKYDSEATLIDFTYNIDDTHTINLYLRDEMVYAEFNYNNSYRIKAPVAFLSNLELDDPSSIIDKLNIKDSAILTAALLTMINYQLTDNGYSIQVTSKSVSNFLSVLSTQLSNPLVLNFAVSSLKSLSNEVFNLVPNLDPSVIAALGDIIDEEEIIEKVKENIVVIQDFLKTFNFTLKFDVNQKEFSGIKIINFNYEYQNGEEPKTTINVNLKLTELAYCDPYEVIDSNYPSADIKEVIDKIKEGLNI